ncbi:MAG: hypothetical protein LQ338_002176 [Usnochroma carphineum]|nr:MAG: hypothetical protein LQ338_002176 [Usnochroma carphineum]
MVTHERVLVPDHTPKPLPNHLRSELTSALLSTSAIPLIQSTLHDAAQKAGWTEALRGRGKQLINSGQATTWQEVVELLVKESCGSPESRPSMPGGLQRRGLHQDIGAETAKSTEETIRVKFPEQAIREGKNVIRDALDHVVELESAGTTR